MDKEDIALKSVVRRGVPLSAMVLSIVVTAAVVSGVFLVQRRFATGDSTKSHQSVTPGASQSAPTIPKPCARRRVQW